MIDPEITAEIKKYIEQHRHKNVDSPKLDANDLLNLTIPSSAWSLVHYEAGTSSDFTISGLDLTTDIEYWVVFRGWASAAGALSVRINANNTLHNYVNQYVENRNSAVETTGTQSSWADPPTATDWDLAGGRNFSSYNTNLYLSRLKTNNYHIVGNWKTTGHGTDIAGSKYYDQGSIHGSGAYGSNADQNLTSLEILSAVTFDYNVWIFKPALA